MKQIKSRCCGMHAPISFCGKCCLVLADVLFDFHFLAMVLPGLVPFLCASQLQISTLEDLFITF